MRCRRLVFEEPKKVAVEEVDVAEPSEGQILIRTLVTLISTDKELTMFNGEFPKGSVWDRITRYPVTPRLL
ncbi:hypothetical protein CW712_05355 [Candidatus Bathyarchaeota archaeon]|nr:MAG: hypothetical protein CW712_05355 [Candidatus Bathyarchaeota archaeon]